MGWAQTSQARSVIYVFIAIIVVGALAVALVTRTVCSNISIVVEETTTTHQDTNVKSKDRILQSQPSDPDDEVAEQIANDTDKAFDAGHIWFEDPSQPEAQCL